MWMPDWLYERLPYLYLIAAGVSLWALGVSFASSLSAGLLCCAALIAHIQRKSARGWIHLTESPRRQRS